MERRTRLHVNNNFHLARDMVVNIDECRREFRPHSILPITSEQPTAPIISNNENMNSLVLENVNNHTCSAINQPVSEDLPPSYDEALSRNVIV